MKIEIEGNKIRLTGEHGKGIIIYYNKEDDYFGMSIFQNGFEIGCLPTVTFSKNHTIIHNNLEKGTIVQD